MDGSSTTGMEDSSTTGPPPITPTGSTDTIDPDTTAGSDTGTTDATDDTTDDTTTTGPVICDPLMLPDELISQPSEDQAIYRALGVDVEGADLDLFQMFFFADDTGAIALGEGANANPMTCTQCVVLQTDIQPGAGPAQLYFADMGTIDIDPATPPFAGEMMASYTGVRLVAVEPGNLEPIPGGPCYEVVDGSVLGVTTIEGWTCTTGFYAAGDGCDCGCGIVDPDCPDGTAASCDFCIEGSGSCVPTGVDCEQAVLPDDNGTCDLQSLWTCDPMLYDAGDGACDCGCGVPDPDCISGFVNACTGCGATGSCSEGEIDCGTFVDPDDNYLCNPIPGWTCAPNLYGMADGCNCGCGIADPDCPDGLAASCDVCNNYGSCAPLAPHAPTSSRPTPTPGARRAWPGPVTRCSTGPATGSAIVAVACSIRTARVPRVGCATSAMTWARAVKEGAAAR